MIRADRSVAIGAAVLLVLLASTSAIVGSAAAQQSATATATAAPNGSEDADTVTARVDEDVYVEKYWYNAQNETFWVRLVNDGDRSKSVTMTEAISRDAKGERRFGIAVVDVDAGETVEASVSAKRVDGAAGVMVLTQRAIETGSGLYLQESKEEDYRLIKGGAKGSHVRSGALGGGVASLLLVVLGAWQYIATKGEDVRDADIDPETTFLGRFRR